MKDRWRFAWAALLVLILVGGFNWVDDQRSLERREFTVENRDFGKIPGVVLMTRPVRRAPVVVFAHGSNARLADAERDLETLAATGVAAVGFDFIPTNTAAFDAAMSAVLGYIESQPWAEPGSVAWVGFSLGSNRLLSYVRAHPEMAPRLLVLLGHNGILEGDEPQPHCEVLIAHGEQDEVFSITNARTLADDWRQHGVSVEFWKFRGAGHDLGEQRPALFRYVGRISKRWVAAPGAGSIFVATWRGCDAWWFAALLWAVGMASFGLSGSSVALRPPVTPVEKLCCWASGVMAATAMMASLGQVLLRLPVGEFFAMLARRFVQ